MIVSASRRTDICAFHSSWFMNRLEAGYAMVRNPVCGNSVLRVPLDPCSVDHIVFITKDPAPMLPHLPDLAERYSVSFQITITPYGRDLEPNVPGIDSAVESFREVSDIIGADRTIWRFDPVMFTDTVYDETFLLSSFAGICDSLAGCTERCIFSLLDYYPKLDPGLGDMGIRACGCLPSFIDSLCSISERHGISLSACCEDDAEISSRVQARACIDARSMRVWNVPYSMPSTPNRKGCGCVRTVDIGEYDTCSHDCRYCYANSSPSDVRKSKVFDPESEFLCGHLNEGDLVTELGRMGQTRLF